MKSRTKAIVTMAATAAMVTALLGGTYATMVGSDSAPPQAI
jgi:hypothetical protein